MTTTSFPLSYVPGGPDANVSHAQWLDLFRTTPGYFDPALEGLTLTLPASGDNATIGQGKYKFQGFVLKVTAPHTLSLPPATTTAKTYYIGIMYDPSKQSDPAGPLYLYAGLTSAVATDTPAGGAFCKLYQVVRQPSQTLNLAAQTPMQQWALAPIFRADDTLPPPAEYAYGQILIQNTPASSGMLTLMVRRGGAGTEVWAKMVGPYADGGNDFSNITLSGGLSAFSATTTPYFTRSAGKFHVGGAVKQTSGGLFLANTLYTIATFGGGNKPAKEVTFPVAVSFAGDATSGRINVGTDGVMKFIAAASVPWFVLDGVSWFPAGV